MGEYVTNGKQVLFRNDEGAPADIHIADADSAEMAHFLATMANAPKAEDGVVPLQELPGGCRGGGHHRGDRAQAEGHERAVDLG